MNCKEKLYTKVTWTRDYKIQHTYVIYAESRKLNQLWKLRGGGGSDMKKQIFIKV